ncbi:MAG: lysophospholipid acyltransferase family protein [Spongiibacteraceae bacterium]
MNYVIRPIKIVIFYVNLIWLGAMLLTGSLLVLPLILTPAGIRQPVVQWGASLIFRLFLAGVAITRIGRFDLAALDALKNERRMLLVPNHPAMIDVFLILSRIPRAVCLMKADISTNPFLGIGAYLAGYISNRQPEKMFRAAIESVRAGNLLLIFPEGTRTTRQPINPIRNSVALIARRAQAPLQTLIITTNTPYLSKGWKIWRVPQFPICYRVTIGERFEPRSSVADTSALLQNYFERMLVRSIDPDMVI